ncbi:MAG: helix-turn-helix domain-containing protein [Pseudomonadota bacterium]|nr:helix-turn-helix domain-containing protein [Pseudomonadota bacterium]
MIIGERLREARENVGLSQQEFAKLAGISQQSLSRLENNLDRTAKKLHKIAKAANVSVDWLDPDMPLASGIKMVPKRGYVGAGAEAHFYDGGDDPNEEVEAPIGSTNNTIAVEVRGNSLGPTFDKALIFYDEVFDPPTPALIKRLCVVGLANGQILVKQLLHGSQHGLYHLMSNTEGVIENADVKWAAIVKAVVPR